jgi:hypothetical protein
MKLVGYYERRANPTIGSVHSDLHRYAERLAGEYHPDIWEELIVAELKRIERSSGQQFNDEVFDDLVMFGLKQFSKYAPHRNPGRRRNATAAEEWRAFWEHQLAEKIDHDLETSQLLGFPVGPTIPDIPRPLAKRYGPNWASRPDAAELEKEFHRQNYERQKAMKAHKKFVEERNRLHRMGA